MAPPREFVAKIAKAFKMTMALERRFALAGGLLLVGPDPTGNGGVIPGFGDHRAIELLVEAGFSPVEAIRVGTLNGATYWDWLTALARSRRASAPTCWW